MAGTFEDQVQILKGALQRSQTHIANENEAIAGWQGKIDEAKGKIITNEKFVAATEGAIRLLEGSFDKQ